MTQFASGHPRLTLVSKFSKNAQCLDRRIAERETMANEIAAWETTCNQAESTIDWQFTTADARIKLKRLNPSIDD